MESLVKLFCDWSLDNLMDFYRLKVSTLLSRKFYVLSSAPSLHVIGLMRLIVLAKYISNQHLVILLFPTLSRDLVGSQ